MTDLFAKYKNPSDPRTGEEQDPCPLPLPLSARVCVCGGGGVGGLLLQVAAHTFQMLVTGPRTRVSFPFLTNDGVIK